MPLMHQPFNPLLLDIPDQFASKRLVLRAPHAGDGPVVNDAIRESFEDLRRWLRWARTLPSVEDTEIVMRQGAAHFATRETLPLLLFQRDSSQFVGGCSLHHIDWEVPRFEIGYWVRSSLSGQGYITEAVFALTAFAFDHLHAERLEIHCDARNQRSAAVAERAGYRLEARLRSQGRDNEGSLRDWLIYGKIRDDYLNLPTSQPRS